MKKLPRLSFTILITLILIGTVYALSPQQLPVSLYKLSLITTAGVVGYWLDRAIFPYARPNELDANPYGILTAAAMLRRAIIVGCAMLAMSLGA